MSTSIAILSPHQDDAVFSLAECVRRLATSGVRVRVINCFTHSEHAPYRALGDTRPASTIRAAEDRAALADIGVDDVTNLAHLDAPQRLGVSVADVCTDRALDAIDEAAAQRVAASIAPFDATDLLLAPLAGEGAHIDHRIARRAATLAIVPERLAFYEDVPYVLRVSDASTLATVARLASEIGAPLASLAITPIDGGRAKRAAASRYTSQVTAADVDALDIDGGARGHAERIWAAPVIVAALRALVGA